MTDTLVLLRGWLMIVLIAGLLGTGVELLLLKHTDGVWQLAPVVLTAVALAAIAWCLLAGSRLSVRALQGTMSLLVLSGLVGMLQHFRGNVAYERDSNPSLSGAELYRSAVQGSTPSLAPGTMIQLGLIGLLIAFRHPGLSRSKRERQTETENAS